VPRVEQIHGKPPRHAVRKIVFSYCLKLLLPFLLLRTFFAFSVLFLSGKEFNSKKKSFFFFRRDALKEQFGKEPNRVSCLAVKSALLGTRHPRKEKEAALQTVTGKPACLDGKI